VGWELKAKVRKWQKDNRGNKQPICEGCLMTPERYRGNVCPWDWASFIASGDTGALVRHSSYHHLKYVRQFACWQYKFVFLLINKEAWGIGKCLLLVRWLPFVSKGFSISLYHVNMALRSVFNNIPLSHWLII